jgi:3-oxoacyl-(acyl-carrier-protein) synthase
VEHRSRVVTVSRFPPEAGPFVAAEVKGFDIGEYQSYPNARRLPRHTQFAIVAAGRALKDAGLSEKEIQKMNPVVMTGTSLMDSEIINKTIENVQQKGPRFALSRVVYQAPVAAIPAAIAQLIGGARTLALQSACCSGLDAIGHAAEVIACGESDFALCGGTEAPIFYHPMLELRLAGLSPASAERPEELSRPFDLWRTTGVIGEGACVMTLEPESSPRPGYAFIDGYSYASDPLGKVGEGLSSAIICALANGRMRASEVDMISAWGPGHREIDAAEARVLREVFGDRLDEIPTASIKGAIGNAFGAAGAIQVGCAALGLRHSFIPPTVNWLYPDPSCRLSLSARPRYLRARVALIDSHGLSGTNAAMLLHVAD